MPRKSKAEIELELQIHEKNKEIKYLQSQFDEIRVALEVAKTVQAHLEDTLKKVGEK